ncbi:MAG: GSU2204 family CXXCH-containing (seleno)protein [Desulfuromonadaceae bacterium]|nr:GSU2204 family CXXCH-containing (seleno)protein [Desulfuromonadaceae bacterium]
MIKHRTWLTGIAVCALLVPLSAAAADGDKSYSATLEAGAAAINTNDDIKKVNEYSVLRTQNGVNPYGKADLNIHQSGLVFDGSVRYMDPVDQDHSANLDVKRVFRTDFSYSVLQHWLDHDKMQYLDAAVPPPSSYTGTAANPLPLTPQNVPAFWYNPNPGTLTSAYGGSSATAPAGYTAQQIGRASVFGEDLTPDAVFKIKRTEWTSKSDLTIPQLPNLTFHFKYRNEDRKGMEQSIGMSKCSSCHVTGQSRNVDENTRDITTGVTGRFGLLTLDYSFMNREFRENAATPTRYYDPALSPGAGVPATYNNNPTGYAFFDNRLLYDYRDGLLRYDETPDSKKDSHIIKAKMDLPGSTSLMGSYVRSTVDSGKTGEPGNFSFNGNNGVTLHTTYDAYGGKLTSTFGKNLTINLRGRAERLKNDDVDINFSTIANSGTPTGNNFIPAPDSLATRYSSLSRDTVTAGIDAAYRMALRTTLRLGYDFQLLDREDEHLGTTKTQTVKASINTRATKTLSGRATVTYKVIDDPYHNPNAALTALTTNTFGSTVGNGATYGISLYDERTANLTNQPEKVVDGVLSGTWSPSPRYSVTAMYRVKREENSLNSSSWDQTTHSPGLTAWYAPGNKVNITLSYNYLNQSSGTAFCQGWYDG